MKKTIIIMTLLTSVLTGCQNNEKVVEEKDDFQYLLEQFADLKIMRYKISGFNELTLQQKELIYYLSEAANCGRDILFDQFYKYNLTIRKTNDVIFTTYSGNKESEEYRKYEVYIKRVWFSNGIHHHYSTDKFFPEVSEEFFKELVINSDTSKLPLNEGQSVDEFVSKIIPIIFDKNIASKRIVLDDSKDIIAESASNFYQGLTKKEVEKHNAKFVHPDENRPVEVGLNSQLVKINGDIVEKTYKLDGLYGEAIQKIIYWLEKAETVAETKQQKEAIGLLIKYYKSGDLTDWDNYNAAWVQELTAQVDFVNGFIETYGDPMGMKATWESVVNFKNIEATKRTEIISNNAQWFEDNAPIDPKFKKEEVKGVSAKVISVAQLGGDCYPSTPIGINLPNSDWIRRDLGSKSVTIENITDAYHKASEGSGFLEEFANSEDEIELSKKYGSLAGNLHTDLHECLGHGSGKLLPETSSDALKNYSSALEEARADLFALYYIGDSQMVELGLTESFDVAKAEYNSYLRNGLMTQLTRVELGKDIEQAHMRNRQLISRWCLEKSSESKTVELVKTEGKTFVVINDYQKLRLMFGELLAEIQRIKSEGDFEAGKALVETYAIKVDYELHKEVLERYEKLGIAPYGGFVNPVLKPIFENNKIIDIKVDYNESYSEQMIRLGEKYSFL